jgi:hypothetical protein
MLVEGKDGVAITCDRCGSRLVIASHPMQPAAQRLPTGWMRTSDTAHNCPLCSQSALSAFRGGRPNR